jgi:hypothetical protein
MHYLASDLSGGSTALSPESSKQKTSQPDGKDGLGSVEQDPMKAPFAPHNRNDEAIERDD